jgi:hypothetical protein
VLAPDPALPCGGDSGGPVLIADELVGVIAFGDPACAISGTSMRLDIHLDAFVRPVLARIAATAGSSRAPFDPDAASCTACEVTDDCPRGTACVDGTCAILGGELGMLGATCTSDTSCGQSPCVAGFDETACRCLTRCATGGSSCAVDGRSGNLSFAFLLALVTTIVSRRRTKTARRSSDG